MVRKNKSVVTETEVSKKPNREIIMDLIREGNQTDATLMEAMGINKAGIASLKSARVMIAEGVVSAGGTGEVPMKNKDGIYYIGTYAEYMEKQAASGGAVGAKKEMTVEQVLDRAHKREDKASSAVATREKAFNNDGCEENRIRFEIAKLQLQLEGVRLSKVENGDYSGEHVTIVDTVAAPAEVQPQGEMI